MKYLLILVLFNTNLYAEIILDNTLNDGILNGPDYAIGAELGQQYGNNLFHSFAQFNLNSNESATFSGPDNINNIISRVTGGSISNIDGTLTNTIPNSNFYLINPAGLIFGPNAVLDMQGSFHASSADILYLQDGGQFNASNPQNSNLTVAPVADFGFLTNSPAALSIENNRKIATPIGKTFSLIGGDINIHKSRITAASGKINIVSVAGKDKISALSPTSNQAGNITIHNSLITVSGGDSSGGIFIQAEKLLIENESIIAANTRNANDAGNINIKANELLLTGASRLMSSTTASGDGGNITLNVKGITEFSGDKIKTNGSFSASGINTSARSSGNAGKVNIKTGSLKLADGASINATVYNSGQGGNIYIKATGNINLSGIGNLKQGSSIAANTRGKAGDAGTGGEITMEAKNIRLNDGALIGSNAIGTGQGGKIVMKADSITLTGNDKRGVNSGISSIAYSSGDGGTITLTAKQLNILNGTNVNVLSGGTGQGGNINIQADNIKLTGINAAKNGSRIVANAQGKAINAGDGGTIKISAKNLQLSDGAQIGTATFGSGQGGIIIVDVETANISGKDQSKNTYRSGIITESATEKSGNAGTIILTANSLNLDTEALITTKTFGTGTGGNMTIQTETLRLSNNSLISARSEGSGNAGQIQLTIGNKLYLTDSIIETSAIQADGGNMSINSLGYVYLSNSQISTSVNENFGNGGNITLQPEFVVLNQGKIFAKAKKGAGGNINILTNGIYNFNKVPISEVISASSEFGLDGIVAIETPDENLAESLYIMSDSFSDASGLLNTPCSHRIATNLSSFTIKVSEGVPSSFADYLPSGPLLAEQLDMKAQLSMNWTPPTNIYKVKSSCSLSGQLMI
ncbi:MAG TPA: filamentous hemagglutinin N-terminal domain-containing protein [Thioploca sp.]|nr:filamentous hemagglutinin N-terminal domain-containing protein [Thioploca sp.]